MLLTKDMELEAIGTLFLIGKLLSALEGSRQHTQNCQRRRAMNSYPYFFGEEKKKSLLPLKHTKFRKYKVAGNQEESSQTVMTKHKH